jgi:16S rRNA (guanine527-N7)-methyltransferase
VFVDRLPLAETYAALLADAGVVRGLIGPREVPRLWDRHLLNCAVVSDEIERGGDVCDLGSGAGLPGLVLAIRRPDLRVTLVEPLLRRATFLSEAVDQLELDNVTVVRARAEELRGHAGFSVVTSRALAPLPRLLDWSLPLVRPGGVMLALKGRSAVEEVSAAAAQLRDWGVDAVDVRELGRGIMHPPSTVVRVAATSESELHWRHSGRAGVDAPARRRRGKGRRT